MSQFFKFESDFVESLRCIPMQVRYKLDTCGVKLKLKHWHEFPQSVRREALERPCQTPAEQEDYRTWLQQQAIAHTDLPAKDLPIDDNPPWLNDDVVPSNVIEKAGEFNATIAPPQWQNLTLLQRFALLKLSRPGHENKNFLPALKEFGLV